jgi:uncharacterized membrane protein (DUF441 family)
MNGVSVHGVDGTVMLTLLITPSSLNLSLLVSVLAHDGVTLLGSDQEFVRMGILVVAERSTSINFTFGIIGISKG